MMAIYQNRKAWSEQSGRADLPESSNGGAGAIYQWLVYGKYVDNRMVLERNGKTDSSIPHNKLGGASSFRNGANGNPVHAVILRARDPGMGYLAASLHGLEGHPETGQIAEALVWKVPDKYKMYEKLALDAYADVDGHLKEGREYFRVEKGQEHVISAADKAANAARVELGLVDMMRVTIFNTKAAAEKQAQGKDVELCQDANSVRLIPRRFYYFIEHLKTASYM